MSAFDLPMTPDRMRELWDALRSRVLTTEELNRVGLYSHILNVQEGVGYNPIEKAQEMTNALLIQLLLVESANAAKAQPVPDSKEERQNKESEKSQ